MTIEEIYKKETGFDAYKLSVLGRKLYRDNYVEWLEKQLTIHSVSQKRELLIGYIMNEQRLYCGKPDLKLSEDLADDYIANL